jgi:hypothetical protein
MHRNYKCGLYTNNRIKYNYIAQSNTNNYYIPVKKEIDADVHTTIACYRDKIIIDKLYQWRDKAQKEKINAKYTKASLY